MTSNKNYTLRVDLGAADDTTAYKQYEVFRISEGPDYTLSLEGTETGTAGTTSGLSSHHGDVFVTSIDNSTHTMFVKYHLIGGWWLKRNAFAHLNGVYITPGHLSYPRSSGVGIFWHPWKKYEALKTTSMKIRPL